MGTWSPLNHAEVVASIWLIASAGKPVSCEGRVMDGEKQIMTITGPTQKSVTQQLETIYGPRRPFSWPP